MTLYIIASYALNLAVDNGVQLTSNARPLTDGFTMTSWKRKAVWTEYLSRITTDMGRALGKQKQQRFTVIFLLFIYIWKCIESGW